MIVQTAGDAIAIHLEIISVTVHIVGGKNAEGSAIFFDGLAHLDHFGNAIGALGEIGEICPAVARFQRHAVAINEGLEGLARIPIDKGFPEGLKSPETQIGDVLQRCFQPDVRSRAAEKYPK
jgi:hypothetical protein